MKILRQYLRLPVYQGHDDKTRAAQALETTLIVLGAVAAVSIIPALLITPAGLRLPVSLVILGLVGALWFARYLAHALLEARQQIEKLTSVEQALRASEVRFRTLFEAVPYLACVARPDGTCIVLNPSGLEWSGWSVEQVAGVNLYRLMDLDDSVVARISQTMATTGELNDEDLRVRLADGALRHVLFSARKIEFAGQAAILASGMDITERTQVDEKLRESESRFRTVFELAPYGITIQRLGGQFVAANRAFQNLLGLAEEQILGKNMTELGIVEDSNVVQHLSQTLRTEGRFVNQELALKRLDGRPSLALVSSQQIQLAGEVHVLTVGLDITERKQAEEALRDERNLLRTLIDNLPDNIYVKDRSGRFLLNNRVSLQILAAARQEAVLGKTDRDFFPDQRADEWDTENASILQCGESEIDAEVFQPWNPEERRWVSQSRIPLRDGQGVIVGLVGINRDITQRKLAEEALRQSENRYRALNAELERRVSQRTAQLEAANQELEAFTYSVSHDLRAPLRAIDGFSRTLAQHFAADLPDKAQHHLGRIQYNAQHMGDLIDDLLALSRIGRKTLSFEPVNMTLLVQEVLGELKANDELGAAEIHVEPLAPCVGDWALLKQVLVNLISNALKYSRKCAQPRVEVRCTSQDGNIVYTVKDNGVGFDMQYVDQLFGVFQRLHTAEDFEGTGIGLVTVSRILARHGGRIWAEAEVDKGATFYFTIAKLEGTTHDYA